jgi:hypothetical protein
MSASPHDMRGGWRSVSTTIGLVGADVWQRDIADRHLTVISSIDDGNLHLSISHRRDDLSPGRYPTWDEIVDARYRFCPDNMTMAMLLPPKAEYVNIHSTTFHLWQIDR